MAYAAWSVSFGEQPSTAKWNILGTNDASFNNGTGIANMALSTTSISNPYKFSVYRSAAKAVTASAETKTEFDAELYDTNNNFDSTTNFRYTAPVSGFYHFDWGFGVSIITPTRLFTVLYKNGSAIQRGTDVASAVQGVSGSCLVQASASDYFEVFYYSGSAGGTYANSTYKDTHFSGHLVSQT